MKTRIILHVFLTLVSACFVTRIVAQEVSIPDPGLNAAVRDALQLRAGPITKRAMLGLTILEVRNQNVASIAGLEAAPNLVALDMESNKLTSVSVPAELTNLVTLDLSFNLLTNCIIPGGLTNLAKLIVEVNPLKTFTLPANLTGLSVLDLSGNQLTNLTLPPDLTELGSLFVDGNPLKTFVVSEGIAATSLAGEIATLQRQGVSVFTYPEVSQLVSPRTSAAGDFEFTLTGPPGIYTVVASTDLITWSKIGVVTNQLGAVVFSDAKAAPRDQRFYRALQ